VAIIGGTHGDELTGIEVVKHFLKTFSLDDCSAGLEVEGDINGELFLIFGNPEAIKLRQRGTTDGRDLNRYFIEEDLNRAPSANDPYDLIRARELAPILAHADYVFDIHATSSDSPPFLVCGQDSPKHREFFQLFSADYVLMDQQNILAVDEGMENRGTTDAYVELHGGMAIGYETGKEDDLSRLKSAINDLQRVLQYIGTLKKEEAIKISTRFQKIFTLSHSVQAKSDHFEYEPGMDNGWQEVKRGQKIGRYIEGGNEIAPDDGMLLFPKSVQKVRKGKNLYYIAQRVSEK